MANDLNSVVDRIFVAFGPDDLMIDTFYKHQWHEQSAYDELVGQFDWIVLLIHDLTFELTRAANYVLDAVRTDLDPLFRLDEGILIVERDESFFNVVQWRATYTPEEIADWPPYRGLAEFCDHRSSRAVHYDEGVNANALRRITPIRIEE
ncbi:MAG TPA: hypothetical protein VFZ97_14700 [Acidimicrobiales bacterium]